MKKIINNKVYDTDTAKLLGGDSYLNPRDFGYWCEELYQKRTGEFFLHGEGGAASKYAKSCGQNSWTGGELIIPLTAQNAMEWAEKHLDADDYIEIFGDPGESGEKETLCVAISADVAKRIRMIASEKGQTLAACVEELLKKASEA